MMMRMMMMMMMMMLGGDDGRLWLLMPNSGARFGGGCRVLRTPASATMTTTTARLLGLAGPGRRGIVFAVDIRILRATVSMWAPLEGWARVG